MLQIQSQPSRAKFLTLASYCYLIAIYWIFLFPVINISSGELKPRGLFIDENAFVLSLKSPSASSLPPLPSHLKATYKVETMHDLIETFNTVLDRDSVRCYMFESEIASCSVRNKRKPRNLEATVLAFPLWFQSGRQHEGNTYAYASNLRNDSDTIADSTAVAFALHLAWLLSEAEWSSRNYILLFIPAERGDVSSSASTTLIYSHHLERWLESYHSTCFPDDIGSIDDILAYGGGDGLIRDSFILRFPSPMKSPLNTHFSLEGLRNMTIDTVTLKVVGKDGVLPNMDFVSVPLSRHFNGNDIFDTEAAWLVNMYRDKKRYLQKKYQLDLAQYIPGNLNNYMERVLGLFSFAWSQVCGPSGIHGQFLHRNIESLTLDVQRRGRGISKKRKQKSMALLTRYVECVMALTLV